MPRALQHDVRGPGGLALGLPRREHLELGRVDDLLGAQRGGERRRLSFGSTAVMSVMPMARSAAMLSVPMGPAPKTMTESPGPAPSG